MVGVRVGSRVEPLRGRYTVSPLQIWSVIFPVTTEKNNKDRKWFQTVKQRKIKNNLVQF